MVSHGTLSHSTVWTTRSRPADVPPTSISRLRSMADANAYRGRSVHVCLWVTARKELKRLPRGAASHATKTRLKIGRRLRPSCDFGCLSTQPMWRPPDCGRAYSSKKKKKITSCIGYPHSQDHKAYIHTIEREAEKSDKPHGWQNGVERTYVHGNKSKKKNKSSLQSGWIA